MADAEHVEIVKKGVEAINAWREEHYPLGMDLYAAYLYEADLTGANLGGANLGRANLDEANLSGADLSGATLSRARLCGANLLGAELRMADLREANLSGAELSLADLTEADLDEAVFDEARFAHTVLGDVDLGAVKGLDKVVHDGPSVVGVDTLFRSRCRIPEEFLRGCGVPEPALVSVRAWAARELEFWTCMVVGSREDEEFCDRLRNDLLARGIRCWVWRWADWQEAVVREIEEKLRRYDRLVPVLSKTALKTEAVVKELGRALEREEELIDEIVFPVRLDDALQGWKHDLKPVMYRREATDFSHHSHALEYEAALDKLVKRLKASPPKPPGKVKILDLD